MPHFVTPNSFGTLREFNQCHAPTDGKFCSGPGRSGRGPLTNYPYPEDSIKIPTYLKKDVARAARAGIVTYHHQQAEPVKDITGKIHDPLSMSHAKRGQDEYYDKATKMRVAAPTGKVRIVTRGGEFDPMETTWGEYGPSGRRQKELTPSDLKHPASKADVLSTYRHEIGHLMDNNFKGGVSTPDTLAREIRAWTYAVELSPGHRVSDRMVRAGLESHAYFELRRQDIAKTMRGNSWDLAENSARAVHREIKDGVMDAPTLDRAQRLANRVATTLKRYGTVLRKRGIGAKAPQGPKPYIGKRWKLGIGSGSEYYRPMPGPGRGGIL